ncbi:MAG: hypothetical protein CVV53_06610 [Spirochaetae bacterium HGW-Spirochaetae-9]|nr:MAG: hypothetical protein CVV53_06610 [Spirochaetae bacterium HGW-Spirochaetae-9]
MRRLGNGGGRVLLLAALMAATGAAARAGAAEELALHGYVQQAASTMTPLSGNLSFKAGASTTLALTLDARHDSAALRVSLHFSILYGVESANQWASLLAFPDAAAFILMTPDFDPLAAAPDTVFLLALDDLALRWDLGSLAFEVGKTYANWGLGKAFSPADFFAEFDYASGAPARRSKFLGRATWFPGSTARIDLVCDPYAAEGPTLAARAYATAFDSLAFSAAAGLRDPVGSSSLTFLGALETTFDLPFVSPYGEAAILTPLDDPAAADFHLLGGAMARAGNLTMLGEYLFSPGAPVQHSVFAQASLPVDEWISLSAPLLYYPEPGSLSTGISLAVNGLEGFDLGMTALAARAASHSWSGKLAVSARFAF